MCVIRECVYVMCVIRECVYCKPYYKIASCCVVRGRGKTHNNSLHVQCVSGERKGGNILQCASVCVFVWMSVRG